MQESCNWLVNTVSEHKRRKEEALACQEETVKKQMANTTRMNELLGCSRSCEDYSRAQDNASQKEPNDAFQKERDEECRNEQKKESQKERDCSWSETAATDVCHERASHQDPRRAENFELEEKLKTGRSWNDEVL